MRPSFLVSIPDGPDGTEATLRAMRLVVLNAKSSMPVRDMALRLTRYLHQKDFRAEVRALWKFVRDNIRYVRDIRGVETIQMPDITLEMGQGDCDDKSVLLAAMLESLGHPTRFKALAFEPGRYSHVLIETKIGGAGAWVPLETTEPVPFGWQPPDALEGLIIFNQ